MLVRQARRLSSTGRLSCFTRYNNYSNNKRAAKRRFLSTTTDSPLDALIVTGSGVAGCAAALVAAHYYEIPVKLLYAGQALTDCNSYWAQGGIIYQNPAAGDSPALLADDIMRAGAGLCRPDAVHKVATQGPGIVEELLLNPEPHFANVPFDRNDDDGSLKCCLEASHAAPRIIHSADHTGKLITQHLTAAAARHPLIELVPDTLVTDVLVEDNNVCRGVATLHRPSGKLQELHSNRGIVLANGGLAGIYQHSTNPSGFNALGSSVGIAQRASVTMDDLEYVQFHPTSLHIPGQARFLLTEALRGEGAVLRNSSGKAFARDFHVDGELAPRDVVARGVFEESQVPGNQVFLDITHLQADYLYARFPSIHAHLQTKGLDMARDWMPVIPAAHYTCGGVSTDLHGCTSMPGLYAAGEAARTGLHGGNRLASTSLLEGLVFGAAVAHHVGSSSESKQHYEGLSSMSTTTTRQKEAPSMNHSSSSARDAIVSRATVLLQQVRQTMWDHVGVVRTRSGLQTARSELQAIQEESEDLFASHPCQETVALRDASHAGYAVTQAALANPVSAGAHWIVEEEEEDELEAAGAN